MSDFTLSQERLDDAVNVIVQFLRDSGYEGSLEDGTGLNDIVIKPSALIYELFSQTLDKAQAYQSLHKALELRENLGSEEFDSAVDNILSNWFMTRNEGKQSTGYLRLWFLRPLDFVQFRDGAELGFINTETLVVDGEQVFTETSFSSILNTTGNQNEYYIDVAVRTASYSEFAPTAGNNAELNVAYKDIYYLRATIPSNFVAGLLKESSDDFINRTKQAITTRELITARAIRTVLMDTFSDIISLYVARHGSKEQLRDIVEFQKVRVHVGNKADIYLASQLTRQILKVQTDTQGYIDPVQLPNNATIVHYLSAQTEQQEFPLLVSCEEQTYAAYGSKPTSLQCVGISEPTEVSLTLLTDTLVSRVHNFVFSDEQRVTCYDPLVRHKFVFVLYPTIEVTLIDRSIDSSNAIKTAVLHYLQTVVIHSQAWIMSELIAQIHTEVANVKKIVMPVQCHGVIFDPLMQNFVSLDVASKFTIDEDYTQTHSKQISDQTVQFYTDSELITVVID